MMITAVVLVGLTTSILVAAVWEFAHHRRIESRWIHVMGSLRSKKKEGPPFLLPLLGGLLFIYASLNAPWTSLGILVLSVVLWKGHRIEKKRQTKWQQLRDVSFFLDLLSLGHSAGYSFEAAWTKASYHMPEGSFGNQVRRLSQSFKLGTTRKSALADMAKSMAHPSLVAVWPLIQQGLEKGFPLKQILLDQSAVTRDALHLEIEERANTLSIRLLFPILLFIFPCLFIMIFAPFILYYLQGG